MVTLREQWRAWRGRVASAPRRADAHPDAPPRAPLSAAELDFAPMGRPVVPVPTLPVPMAGPLEREVPADLDTPLSALDPAAIPIVPREPVRPVVPLAPGERLETFALPPEGEAVEALLRWLGDASGATRK